jgi:hypothetical protein
LNSFTYIKSTFLKLTSKTYPYGTEDELVEDMIRQGIFPNLEKDDWGNYLIKIGQSRTIFTAHLDTACRDQVDVKHYISKQQIVTTDGKTILGADDKAGVTILLWLVKNNIPGLYYFFIGEEVGCVGSSAASVYGQFKGFYDRVISFDRRGTNSVITFQSSSRSCSDEFANELSAQLNKFSNLYYKADNTGVYTDSAEFVDIVPECTNISVGYQSEHTFCESQDLYHLNKLALACLDVKWEELPTKRVAGTRESKWDNWSYPSHSTSKEETYSEYDDYGYGWSSSYSDVDYTYRGRKKTRRGPRNRKEEFENLKNGRTFYDRGGELVEFTKSNKGIYDVYRDKFLTSDLTKEELDLIRDQYLDMSNPYDIGEYKKLCHFL